MGLLLDRTERSNGRGQERGSSRTSSGGTQPRSASSAGVTAALKAAGISGLFVLVPVVVAWIFSGGERSSLFAALRVGGALWLLAHHVALTLPGGSLSLVPLGALIIPLGCCAVFGMRLARLLDPRAGSSRSRPVPAPRLALVSMTGAYAAIALGVAVLSESRQLAPVTWQAPVGAGVIAALGGWLGSQSYAQGGWHGLIDLAYELLPARAERFVGPTLSAVGVQLGFGAISVLVGVVLGFSRVSDLYGALQPGFIGAVMVTLLQLLLLPNLVIWGAAWLTGPGVSLGTGTAVTLAENTLGPLPAIPVLGALPDPGAMPVWAMLGVAAGVISGAVGGYRLLDRSTFRPASGDALWAPVVDICVLTVTGTALFGLLCLLSSGAAGPGRLAYVGPVWAVLPAFAIQLAVGSGLVYLVCLVAPAIADLRAGRR